MTGQKLEKEYCDFWLQYSSALPRDISLSPSEKSNPFKVATQGGQTFLIKLRLDFYRCRYKTVSDKKRDIAIRIDGSKTCIFSPDDRPRIIQSNVTVEYLRVDESNQEATPMVCLHYDYEANSQSLSNHPIYHCQLASHSLDDKIILGREFSILLPNELDGRILYKHIRIPTANMDMISILLSIAADHFTDQEFRKVLKAYDHDQWHDKLPHLSHHAKFSPGINFRSRSWYIG